MLKSETDEGYINILLEDGRQSLSGINNEYSGFFTYSSIANIPRIEYPDFTNKNNDDAYRLAREVMYRSKMDNHCREVAITYNMNKNLETSEDYAIVFGDEKNVSFYKDIKTRQIIDGTEDLFIINIHNHPNYTGFSVKDLIIFSGTPNIKMMSVINKNGEISYITRKNEEKYIDILYDILQSFIPQENGITSEALDFLTEKETNIIRDLFIKKILTKGCTFSDFVGNKNILQNKSEEQEIYDV